LGPGENKILIVDFIALESINPDLYLGEIVIKSRGSEGRVIAAMEVISEGALFDIRLDVPNRYLVISPGDVLPYSVTILSLGREGRVDTKVNYQIKDRTGNVIAESDELIAVDVQTSLLREFKMPLTIAAGDYVLYANVGYNGKTGSASQWFEIREKTLNNYMLIMGIIVLLAAIVISILIKGKKPKKRRKRSQ